MTSNSYLLPNSSHFSLVLAHEALDLLLVVLLNFVPNSELFVLGVVRLTNGLVSSFKVFVVFICSELAYGNEKACKPSTARINCAMNAVLFAAMKVAITACRISALLNQLEGCERTYCHLSWTVWQARKPSCHLSPRRRHAPYFANGRIACKNKSLSNISPSSP